MLLAAAFSEQPEIIQLLVSKGADLFVRNKIGLTPQQEAVGKSLNVFEKIV